MTSNLMPRVAGLFTAESAGSDMTAHEAVSAVAGVGIPGDRYATGRGHWSDPRWPDQQLTLAELEVATAVGVEALALRRNVVTSGIRLESLIGASFRIGDAILEGVRRCDPCAYLDSLTRAGLHRELVGRGGLRARIVSSGTMRVGDAIVIEAGPRP